MSYSPPNMDHIKDYISLSRVGYEKENILLTANSGDLINKSIVKESFNRQDILSLLEDKRIRLATDEEVSLNTKKVAADKKEQKEIENIKDNPNRIIFTDEAVIDDNTDKIKELCRYVQILQQKAEDNRVSIEVWAKRVLDLSAEVLELRYGLEKKKPKEQLNEKIIEPKQPKDELNELIAPESEELKEEPQEDKIPIIEEKGQDEDVIEDIPKPKRKKKKRKLTKKG